MKPNDIKIGKSYVNKSGRSERFVIDIGGHVKAYWHSDSEPPADKIGVMFVDTRMGKTVYSEKSGKSPSCFYISSFAQWAKAELPDDAMTTPGREHVRMARVNAEKENMR